MRGSTPAFCVTVGCLAVAALLTDFASPKDLTRSAMRETFVRIDMYARQRKAIPLSLDVLPVRQGHANATTDAWGRPLCYEVRSDGVISLTSLGWDGKPDIVMSYRSRRPDGSLWVGTDHWIVTAEIRTK